MRKEVDISLKLPKSLIAAFKISLPPDISPSAFFEVVIRDYIACHVKGLPQTKSIDEMLRRLIKKGLI